MVEHDRSFVTRCCCCSYMVLNEPRQCDNKHLFCETCIFAWSMTYGENSQRCPVCRCEQKRYDTNVDVRRKLWDKVIRCPEDKCQFKVRVCVRAREENRQSWSTCRSTCLELQPASNVLSAVRY